MSKLRVDVSSARTRSFSAGGSGGGTVSSPGLTVPRIPYASAAQVLGDTLIQWDNVAGCAALGMAPVAGNQFSVMADTANIGAYTGLATGFAGIFCNSTTAAASLGMRFYSETAPGTWLTLNAAKMALLSTSGKPSALVIAGINDVDAIKIPVYIGQKTTTFDDWIARFTNASMEIRGIVGINIAPHPYTGLSVSASDVRASISISTPLNTNAAVLSISGDDGSFYNRSYGSTAAGTALGINNANAQDITVQYYTLPTCLRIYGDNQEDTFKVPVYIGQRTTNFDAWLVKFDNSIARFAATVQLDTVTLSTLVYANASKQLVSLANAAGYLSNDGAGVLSWGAVSVTGFIKDPGGLTDGQVLIFETGGNARNSPINADSTNGTIGVSSNANSGDLISGRKDPANINLWAISGNSYESYCCHGGDSRGGIFNYRESYTGTLYTLSKANMLFFGTDSGKATSLVFGSVNSNDTAIVPIYIAQKSTSIDNWSFRLASDRIATFKFTQNDNTAQTVLNLLRQRTDATFTYNDDMGEMIFSLQDTAINAGAVKFQFGALASGGGKGIFKFQVNTNISGAASWNPIFYYNGSKVYISCDGNATIELKNGANSNFTAATSWAVEIFGNGGAGGQISVSTGINIQALLDTDINLTTSGTGRVNFQGISVVTTTISATGYLPIKIGGSAYKMLVST